MKKFLGFIIGLTFCFCCYAAKGPVSGDIDLGFLYGFGTASFNETNNGITIDKVSSSGPGVYLRAALDINKYFGFFDEIDFTFPTKTSIEAKAAGYSLSLDNILKVKFVMNGIIGFYGKIPVSEKFKIRLGGGLDIGLMYMKGDVSYSYTTITVTETDFIVGLGLQAMAVYLISERLGINFGINADFYFGGTALSRVESKNYKQSDSSSFSRNINFIRPQIGLTIHFPKK